MSPAAKPQIAHPVNNGTQILSIKLAKSVMLKVASTTFQLSVGLVTHCPTLKAKKNIGAAVSGLLNQTAPKAAGRLTRKIIDNGTQSSICIGSGTKASVTPRPRPPATCFLFSIQIGCRKNHFPSQPNFFFANTSNLLR